MKLFLLRFVSLLVFILIALTLNAGAQIRVAVLPFQNMNGNMKLNIYCYKLQDSISNALREKDTQEAYFHVVPIDSIEQVLASMNVDPTNPQYPSDMWKAVKLLNIQKVITGSFNMEADNLMINAFVYDVRTKLPHPKYQARDVFKTEDKVMEAVPFIVKKISPMFISQ